MPTVPLRTVAGGAAGRSSLDDALFGMQPNVPSCTRWSPPSWRRPAGHPEHQDPGRGVRRRQQAVPPEGHRPGPPGLDPGAALGRRRGGPRPQAA